MLVVFLLFVDLTHESEEEKITEREKNFSPVLFKLSHYSVNVYVLFSEDT